MEAVHGVGFDHAHGEYEKVTKMDGLGPSVNKENENIDNSDDHVQLNGAHEDPSKAEGLGSSGIEGGDCVPAMERKCLKKHGSNNGDRLNKNNKEKMDKVGRNSLTIIPRSQRTALSKSLSFPSKGVLTNGLRKSTTDVKQLKLETKGCHLNGTGVPSSGPNGLFPWKRTSLASKSSNLWPPALKSASVDATSSGTASEAPQSATPRVGSQRSSSVSGFSFRLDERAEKRKEFFQKLEEKEHAKEVENTSLQAKSKENQEAEIKQLRKSLTFKATPMPSFYNEPGPSKVKLKKIPTTRPISPKLGRHKSNSAAENSRGNVPIRSSCSSFDPSKPNGTVTNENRDSSTTKGPVQKSLLKLPSQRSTVTRPGASSMKPKVSETEFEAAIEKIEVEENMGKVLQGNPAEAESVRLNTSNKVEGDGETTIVALPNNEIETSNEVSVRG